MNVDRLMTFPLPDDTNNFLADHVALMANSFERLLGRPLADVARNESMGEKVYHAPFVLLSHNTKAEPIFNYANAKALELFELSWYELITLPSRLSAEFVNQEARATLLAEVTTNGFIDNYQGIRISSTGKRFKISHAVVWNLVDDEDRYQGQAACFSDWVFL